MIKLFAHEMGNGVRVVAGYDPEEMKIVSASVQIVKEISNRPIWTDFVKVEIVRGRPTVMDSTTFSNYHDFDQLTTIAVAHKTIFEELGNVYEEQDFGFSGFEEIARA